MSFGVIGLFHRFCQAPRFWVRYLSDSSYWLYLVHIPLLMVFQFLVRDWPVPSFVKFSLVCTATTALGLDSLLRGNQDLAAADIDGLEAEVDAILSGE